MTQTTQDYLDHVSDTDDFDPRIGEALPPGLQALEQDQVLRGLQRTCILGRPRHVSIGLKVSQVVGFTGYRQGLRVS